MTDDGRVLGTFGTYFRDRRAPTEEERTGVAHLATTAAQVLAAGL
jgi:GAF domain-containing protein